MKVSHWLINCFIFSTLTAYREDLLPTDPQTSSQVCLKATARRRTKVSTPWSCKGSRPDRKRSKRHDDTTSEGTRDDTLPTNPSGTALPTQHAPPITSSRRPSRPILRAQRIRHIACARARTPRSRPPTPQSKTRTLRYAFGKKSFQRDEPSIEARFRPESRASA